MAIAVVLIVIAVVLAVSVRWWRHAQGDQRSLEAYHTLINRLEQIDAQNHVDKRVPVDEPRRAEGADWGPPVRLLPHPQEPARTPVARPASQPGQASEGAPAQGHTSQSTASRPVEPTRPVMFFDDFATAAKRPKPAPAAIAIRDGDRPWLGTARQYAVPVTVAFLAAVISLGSLAAVSSSNARARKVVSSGHPHAGGTPAPANPVRVAPGPASPAPAAAPVSSPSTSAPTASPAAPAATGGPQLTVVSPASGAPGQEVTLAGAGLFSSDGLIVVRFGAAQATVDCPNQSTCQAIVPNTPGSAGAGAQMITVSTGAGTSNPLKFTYTS